MGILGSVRDEGLGGITREGQEAVVVTVRAAECAALRMTASVHFRQAELAGSPALLVRTENLPLKTYSFPYSPGGSGAPPTWV